VVGLAYQHLVRLFGTELGEAPTIEDVLEAAPAATAREVTKLHA
jgi:hypothetical protein